MRRRHRGLRLSHGDAIAAADAQGTPKVLVYRKNGAPDANLDDPELEEKCEQWARVKAFFEGFKNPDGSFRRSYRQYDTPSHFKEMLDENLRDIVAGYRAARPVDMAPSTAAPEDPVCAEPEWPGCPFPGLRAFTTEQALIFHGRGRETDGLIERLKKADTRFIVVVGASGTGKSSLVAAGLLPALAGDALAGSRDWISVRFTPAEVGDDPFMALAVALKPLLEKHGRLPRDAARDLETNPATVNELAALALEHKPDWAELILFIDQFEELFTLVEEKHRDPFIELLAVSAQTPRLRMVLTMRSDFYHRCLDCPKLDKLVADGQYPLLCPRTTALHEMIVRPAGQAGLRLDGGLAQRILDEVGSEPGGLALMAFALYELWKARTEDGRLTAEAYDAFGGVEGAIGRRAEDAFNDLVGEASVKETSLARVFRDLVEVDERGVATRRRAPVAHVSAWASAKALVDALTEARLLVTNRGEGNVPMVEVAHEAIFSTWQRLQQWIQATTEDLRLRRQVRQAAAEWDDRGRPKGHLWSDERVVEVVGMLTRLGLGFDRLSETEHRFLGPMDRDAMLRQLDDPATSHEQRATIGVRLSLLGDPRAGLGLRADGLPDPVWCKVPGGEASIEGVEGPFEVKPFFVAKYPITWVQYRTFLEADDGYHSPVWWKGLMGQFEKPGRQVNRRDNHPAENLAWLDAVAYCRWLSAKLGYEIRLPTEWEWQQAATGGNPANAYPWGPDWDAGRANTYESELNRSTAVGMYPHGASPVGAIDMSGNVWELCLNEYDNPTRTDVGGDKSRAVRGGSWSDLRDLAAASFRDYGLHPADRSGYLGVRVVCASPIL